MRLARPCSRHVEGLLAQVADLPRPASPNNFSQVPSPLGTHHEQETASANWMFFS